MHRQIDELRNRLAAIEEAPELKPVRGSNTEEIAGQSGISS